MILEVAAAWADYRLRAARGASSAGREDRRAGPYFWPGKGPKITDVLVVGAATDDAAWHRLPGSPDRYDRASRHRPPMESLTMNQTRFRPVACLIVACALWGAAADGAVAGGRCDPCGDSFWRMMRCDDPCGDSFWRMMRCDGCLGSERCGRPRCSSRGCGDPHCSQCGCRPEPPTGCSCCDGPRPVLWVPRCPGCSNWFRRSQSCPQ